MWKKQKPEHRLFTTEHSRNIGKRTGVKSGLRAAGSFGSFRALLEVRP
jgi:hypothetical protein